MGILSPKEHKIPPNELMLNAYFKEKTGQDDMNAARPLSYRAVVWIKGDGPQQEGWKW